MSDGYAVNRILTKGNMNFSAVIFSIRSGNLRIYRR